MIPVPKGPGFFLPGPTQAPLILKLKQIKPMKPMQQDYSKYTDEDRLVWKTLFDRQMKNLETMASRHFIDALQEVEFRPDKIPDFKELDKLLGSKTGWAMEVVPNIIPQKDFFQTLDLKHFPATTWLRRMDQLDYLEEPDMFHDVFGHVPLLSNKAYTGFFKGMAELALKHLDSPLAIELLGRIYWFTIEFGLMNENGQKKVYGAGIISSAGETLYSLSDKPAHLPFDVRSVMQSTFRTDVFQEKYFVVDSFEALYESLSEIEKVLEEELESARLLDKSAAL
jgi:phenylalanine-4-hydroxylase